MEKNFETLKTEVLAEEPKKKRDRSPNKTKAEKLEIIDTKIKWHEDHYAKLVDEKARVVADLDRKMGDALRQLDKLRADRKAVEEKPDRATKATIKAAIKAKLAAGETLTPDEHDFLMKNL